MPRRGENIYKRKDGRWEGRIVQPDGKYQYVYGKSYKEVREKKKTSEHQAASGMKKKQGGHECASRLFDAWLQDSLPVRVKPSTYESYYICLKKYVIPFFRNTGNDELSEQNVSRFAISIYENKQLAETYRRKIITVFKVALGDILKTTRQDRTLLDVIPSMKTDDTPVEAFSIKEQQRIESTVQRMEDTRAFGILLSFYTGLRLGELCALKWENIDFEAGTIFILETVTRTKCFGDNPNGNKTRLSAGTPKSQHSIRRIPLPRFLSAHMLRIKKNDSNYILSGTDIPTDPRTYQKLFKKVLAASGVKDRKFHAIRHTFATRGLEAGIDIKTLSEILGHSSAMITLKVYAHSLMEQKIAAINKLGENYISHLKVDPIAVPIAVGMI